MYHDEVENTVVCAGTQFGDVTRTTRISVMFELQHENKPPESRERVQTPVSRVRPHPRLIPIDTVPRSFTVLKFPILTTSFADGMCGTVPLEE